MSGTLEIYDTATLIGVQSRPMNQPDGFWLRWFGREVLSQTEEIMFDDLGDDDRRLAPFVSPMAQGRVMRDKGFVTKSFKPAYVKPKHVVRPDKALHRRPGEGIGGVLTPGQRYEAAVAATMISQRSMVERRLDWMAAQAIAYGAVTVSGEDYPEQNVDFGRDASLTDTLTGTARWGESAADPLGDIKTLRQAAFTLGGYPVNDLIFGPDAWARFTADSAVAALLSTQSRGSTSDFRMPVMNDGSPFAFEGTIGNAAIGSGGEMRLWTYSNYYEETLGGSRVNYIHADDVVGVGTPQGVQAFGAILDADAGLVPMRMFPKMWRNPDPSVTYTMTQSAPLMVPMNPNSTFRLRCYSAS
jgi:hypothetical protein